MLRALLILSCSALAVAACDSLLPGAPPSEAVLAEPIEGLTPAQLASHLAGDEQFARNFGPADGLGPLFVSTSCESCHVGDGKGHETTTLTRFGRQAGEGFDPMKAHGGPQLQHRAIAGYPPEEVPAGVTGVSRFMAPAVTGLGFLEAVSDDVLLSLSDPDDLDGDGISGRPNWIDPPGWYEPAPGRVAEAGRYIGRFGKKAGTLDLLHQTVTAYAEDMGVTTEFQPRDLHNVQVGRETGDHAPDPEVGSDELANVVFYMRTLKVPPRRGAADPEVVEGERLFTEIGCAGCHVPSLRTGPHPMAVFDEVAFHPYTDLLLHDMGPELDDGYTEGIAATSEWRTAPLWGLGLAADAQGGDPRYLHDGRAATLEEAIGYHGGEAARSRERFGALSADDQARVIAFLESL